MLKAGLEQTKRKLLAERELVSESLRRCTEQLLSEIDDSTQDTGDLATANHDKDLLYSLQDSAAKRLNGIDEMLARLENDHYGTCERCGGSISESRLEAIPWTTNCTPCQESLDMELDLTHSERTTATGKRHHAA